jgi:hypothetical protein
VFAAVQEQLRENQRHARQSQRGALYLLQGLARISHQEVREVAERGHGKVRERKLLPSCQSAPSADTLRLSSVAAVGATGKEQGPPASTA